MTRATVNPKWCQRYRVEMMQGTKKLPAKSYETMAEAVAARAAAIAEGLSAWIAPYSTRAACMPKTPGADAWAAKAPRTRLDVVADTLVEALDAPEDATPSTEREPVAIGVDHGGPGGDEDAVVAVMLNAEGRTVIPVRTPEEADEVFGAGSWTAELAKEFMPCTVERPSGILERPPEKKRGRPRAVDPEVVAALDLVGWDEEKIARKLGVSEAEVERILDMPSRLIRPA